MFFEPTPYLPHRAFPYYAPADAPRSLLPWEIDTRASAKWGGTSGKGHRVSIKADALGNLVVRSATESEYEVPWKLPKAEPMIHVWLDDWHGGGWLIFRAGTSDLDIARRVAIAKTIHDPETSQEECCKRKRAGLRASEQAA